MARASAPAAWALAFVLITALAAFQRLTGPTRPLRGSLRVDGHSVGYRLPRSHGGEGGLTVRITVPKGMRGTLLWRRFPTSDPWRADEMRPDGDAIAAVIPHQPPAGKVEYRIELVGTTGASHLVPTDRPVVARFKGAVPAWVLVPHIAAMFAALMAATRAAMGAAVGPAFSVRRPVLVSGLLLVLGGLVLGPIVQRYAFGAFWTGWPLGDDLTDTKTLIGAVAWTPAVVTALRGRAPRFARAAILCGWLVLMVVYLIPHSTRGSQLDWSEAPHADQAAPRSD